MIRDKKHLDFIRGLPCAGCKKPPRNQAAHIRRGSDGGMGLKPSDSRTVPLCAMCHSEQHNVGELSFWYPLGGWERAVVLAKRLYEYTGNRETGIMHIIEFRKLYDDLYN